MDIKECGKYLREIYRNDKKVNRYTEYKDVVLGGIIGAIISLVFWCIVIYLCFIWG